MGSLIKIVASSRLPLINRCVISSRALAATDQRCFFSTINDGRHDHGLKNNLRRVRNVTVNSISNFIYTNIMNRFGLIKERVYGYNAIKIKPSMSQETDECLYYSVQLKGVISHEKVSVSVDHNSLYIQGAVYDEFKAAYHIDTCDIKLPEDGYHLKYNMRGIKADFSEGGELKLTIPKFNAAERMMNEKKDEAGEFLKLKEDAFIFDIKVNAI